MPSVNAMAMILPGQLYSRPGVRLPMLAPMDMAIMLTHTAPIAARHSRHARGERNCPLSSKAARVGTPIAADRMSRASVMR